MKDVPNPYGLSDRVCVITGAGRGLGESIARILYEAGAKVSLFDVNGESAEKVAASLDASHARAIAFRVDVSSEDEVERGVAATVERFGRIDVLVNCAGILKHLPIDEMSLADFDSVIRVNLTGTFLTCRAVAKVMKRQRSGKIVNISSLGGRTGRPGVGVNYAASKAGVIGMSQTLARELGPSGIYVNNIAPGPILTELTKQASSEVFARWNAGRAVEKDGLPEDIAMAVLFLASDQSNWVTGVSLDVNGGIYIK